MKGNTLFKKFIVQSIISFIITGGLLAFFVMNLIVNREIDHNIEVVELTLGHSLDHWFNHVDLDNLTDHDIEELHDEFHSLDSIGNIADIRIWALDGELIYSQYDHLIGELTLEEEHLEITLSDVVDYELTNAEDAENIILSDYGNEFIEIYMPIHHDDEVVAVFEVYRSFDSSRASINNSVRSVLLILLAGLIVLYFFLARTIYKSSNRLIKHNEEIMESRNQLDLSYQRLQKLYRSMIIAITNAVDARDKFTSGHSKRVAEYTVAFCRHLSIDEDTVSQLEIAALLHDIGKLGVPEAVINKPGRLTEKEFAMIKDHPLIGEKIISDVEELKEVLDVVKYHHEQYNGTGYPMGLKGDNIPYHARIIALTDAYDAMISNRPYRSGLPKDVAIQEIKDNSGSQFDPALAQLFCEFILTI